MSTQNKSRRVNIFPQTVVSQNTTVTTPPQTDNYASGVRIYVTTSGGSTGGTETLYLCAVPPKGGNAVPLVGMSGAGMLSTNGVGIFDFYPGAWLPGSLAAGANLRGIAGVYLPMVWCVQIILPTGSTGTISIDVEALP